MSDGGSETYRVRAAAFVGPFALAAIVAAAGCLVWAFGVPHAELIGLGVGALIALVTLVLLIRRPVLVRLDDAGVRVRRRQLDWDRIGKVQQVRTDQGTALQIAGPAEAAALVVPLRWLTPADAERLSTRLAERANTAAGYRSVAEADAGPAAGAAVSPHTDAVPPPRTTPTSSGWSRTGRASSPPDRT